MILSHFNRWLPLVAAAALAATAGDAFAKDLLRDKPPPAQIRDLDYGDVLFHFFQDDYFDALVRLEASRDFGRIPHHEAEAELLAGGLYLSLGLHNEASRIFNKLLAGPVPQSVADRAFFYLARIGYQRGYLDDAWNSLQRIRGPLPGQLEPERRLLASNVLMAQGRYGEAAAQLQGWTDLSDWTAYARFNLDVALVRNGDDAQGRPLLDAVGAMPAATEEQLALRDRANLALGFAALQKHEAEAAVTALNRVRLDGPFTNRALLGLGWAEADAGRMDRALVPWLALRDQPVADAAVQESYLAVPYAYAKLAANGQAAEQYQKAVQAYASETRRIDESIAAIRKGGFLDSILEAVPRTDDIGWFWQLQKVPDAPPTRYLYELLASHEFQEGLKNYRDLRIMQASLQRWKGSLEAFNDMVATRERRTLELEPRRLALLASTNLPALERRQAELAGRATRIQSEHDVGALATGEEATEWQDLERIDAALQAMPEGPQRDDLLDRARVLRGTLAWKLDEDYKVRLRHLQLGVRDTADALAEARLRIERAQQASMTAKRNTAGFADRVNGLASRIDAITPRIDATAAEQEQMLASVAIGALEAQKRRLASYATQAQFALAALYDGAAARGTK